MSRFLKLLCLWLLSVCCVKEASPLPLNGASYQEKKSCQLYKLAPSLSSAPYMKDLLGYGTTELEPFAVFVQEESETTKVEQKLSNAATKECVGHCRGWNSLKKDEADTAVEKIQLQAVYGGKSYEESQLLMVVLAPTGVEQLSTCENTTLLISCPLRQHHCCLHVQLKEDSSAMSVSYSSKLYRRSAALDDHKTLQAGSHDAKSSHRNMTVGVVISVVGVVLLVLVVALCAGGSQTYDPVKSETGGAVSLKKQSTSEVATQPLSSQDANTSVTVSVGIKDEPLTVHKTNGSFSSKEHPPAKQQPQDILPAADSKPEQVEDPPAAAKDSSDSDDPKVKTLSISSRSYDPLPDIPGTEKEEKEEEDMEDELAEAGYDYARFPERNVDRMSGSDSEGEEEDSKENDEPDKQPEAAAAATTGVVPYGKVSRHSNSDKKKDSDEYAEVRETFRNTPRTRAITDPVDPVTLGLDLRDKRAFTESATRLPLPAIPRGQRMAAEQTKPKVQKERLYESVDEMGDHEEEEEEEEGNEDMYESVPDDLKNLESPITPNPAVSSPARLPPVTSVTAAPLPPSSPIPSRNPDGAESKPVEKKPLDKSLSSSNDGEKRRFSFFNRKKATSISAVRNKKDKDLSHHMSSPMTTTAAVLASSPPQMSPPPIPSIPAPAPPPLRNEIDDDDIMYDTPKLDFVRERYVSEPDVAQDAGRLKNIQEAKNKSISLPRNMRPGAGGSPFMPRPKIPLPDLPETSGGGTATVVHKRVFEDPVEGEHTGPYDMVHIIPEPSVDDPSYDTVRPEDILVDQMKNDEEPGYDSVRKSDGQEQQQQQAANGEDVRMKGGSEEATGGMKYAKVTRPGSPDDGRATSPGIQPEHDEEGYAVVPQEIKMRKRAMSATKTVQQKAQGDQSGAKKSPYDSIKKDPIDEKKSRSTSPEVAAIMAEPDEQYAVVDIATKRKKKEKRKESAFVEIEIRQSAASPNPPPVPPMGDVGDLTEFDQPPVPMQSEGVHELVDNKHLVVSGGANDPPYAKVMSKTDHPYTELDLAPKDSGPAKLAQRADSPDVGYDTVGAVGRQRPPEEDHKMRDEALGYDTVSDGERTVAKKGQSSIEREMPKLETADDDDGDTHQQPTYDVLEDPSQAASSPSPPPGNLYDVLESAESPQDGAVSPNEDRYEEIDDEQRLKLISKYHQRSS